MRKALPVFIAVCLVLSLCTGVFAPVPAARAASPPTVNLLSAGNFVILSKGGITNVPTSHITGNVGTTPITGASLGLTSPEVTGIIYTVDAAGPAGRVIDPSLLDTARIDMEAAYVNAANRTPGTGATNLNVGDGTLNGQNFVPGTYTWNTPGNVKITGDITLTGGANDVWIFQITGTLDMAANMTVHLAGGALPQNIFWQVADVVTLFPGSHFEGNILGKTKIAMQNGASINGRLLAQTEVTLIANTVGLSSAELPGTITVIKNTVGGDGTFHFTVSDGLYDVSEFDITTTVGTGVYSVPVTAGVPYTVTEGAEPAGWVSTDLYMVQTATVPTDGTVAAAVYFNNTKLTPTPATYTVTYDANGGTGAQTDSLSPYVTGATVTVLDQGSML